MWGIVPKMLAISSARPLIVASSEKKSNGKFDAFRQSQKKNAKKTGKQIAQAAKTFTQDELKRTRTLFVEHRDLFKEIFSDNDDDVIDAVVVKEESEKYFE